MVVGVLSDSHGATEPIIKALEIFESRKAGLVVHCGDIINVDNLALFSGYNFKYVLGNGDNLFEFNSKANEYGFEPPQRSRIFSVGQKNLAMAHGDDPSLMNKLVTENRVDCLFKGHSHYPENYEYKGVRVLNPGALYRTAQKTVGIYNAGNDSWEIIEL